VAKTVPPDNKEVISEVLVVTLLCKEEISVSKRLCCMFLQKELYYLRSQTPI